MENGKNYGFFKNVSLICCRFPVQADVNYPCPPAGGGRRGGPHAAAAAGRAGVNHIRGGCGMVGVRGGWVGCDEEPCILYICECEFGFMVCVHTGEDGRRRGAAEAASAWRVRDFIKQQR